jgi:8-hydroxy-5-deazaflavin:NADPH oxidoreductase
VICSDGPSVALECPQEALGFLNISLNAANGWPWRTGWKLVGPTT